MFSTGLRNKAIYLIVAVLCLLFLFPFIWLLGSSLKTNFQELADPATLIPSVLHWSNYTDVWQVMNFPRQALNSTIMTLGVTLGQLVTGALAGYGFARMKFAGRDILFVIVLATLIIPFEVLFVPLFIMLSSWGWINTFAALIIPSLANPFSIFVFRQFFLTIPRDLEEAMLVDGASHFRIFRSLMLPLSGPAIATVFILTFLSEWNNLLKPLVFTNSNDMQTLQVGLTYLNTFAFNTEPKIAWMMAGTVLASIPPIVVFLLVQKRFVASIASTGLK